MCDAIYIGNTQQTFKKIDIHFSDRLRLIKNGQISYSFGTHYYQHFNATTSRTYIRKYITLKVVKQLNPFGAVKTFTKPNFNIYVEEFSAILKKICDKQITIMNKNSDI